MTDLPRIPRTSGEHRQWVADMQTKCAPEERGAWLDAIAGEVPPHACAMEWGTVWRWSNPRGLWTLAADWQQRGGSVLVLERGWGGSAPANPDRWSLEDTSPLYLRAVLLLLGAVEP